MSRFSHSKTSWAVVFILAMAIFCAPVSARADQGGVAEDARKFVAGMAERAANSLTEEGIGTAERRKRFRRLMLEYFAFEGIAKWVLGRYWRRASATERTEYLGLFEDLMVVAYADRFAKYSGEKLDVGKSEIRGANDILVHSVFTRPQGLRPVAVVWRMRQRDATFKVVDLMVEGLSMGLTQQKEFTSVIRKHGGKVQGLLDELKKRLAANS